ncbi:MAG: hypothetical protein PHP82_02820 [Candidatus ainarchaeum sp.]|nr:hypothetical protein [Candidatus ainarchaeum sp.]
MVLAAIFAILSGMSSAIFGRIFNNLPLWGAYGGVATLVFLIIILFFAAKKIEKDFFIE